MHIVHLNSQQLSYILFLAKNLPQDFIVSLYYLPKRGIDIIYFSPVHRLIFIKGIGACDANETDAAHRFYNPATLKNAGFFSDKHLKNSKNGFPKISEIADYVYSPAAFVKPKVDSKMMLDTYRKKVPFMGNMFYELKVYRDTLVIHSIIPDAKDKTNIALFYALPKLKK